MPSTGASARTDAPSIAGEGAERIIVTAQRREEDVRSVPIAITTLSGDQAERRGVIDTSDIATIAPGLEFNQIGNAANPFIRGVGAGFVAIGSEASVAVYLDDLIVPQGAGALFRLDGIESISVLRGPQGTLFGRNATGGVIQVRTRDPSADAVAEAALGYASYDTRSASVYVAGGLANGLSGNFAAHASDQANGWGRDVVTGEEAFTASDYGARAKLLWEPWESGRFLFSAAYNRSSGEVGIGVKPVPGSSFRSIITDLAAVAPELVPPADFYDTYAAPLNDEIETEWQGASLRFEQDLGWAQLVSITGWQQQRGHFFFNQDGSPLALVYAQIFQSDDNRTQELQLISSEASSLRWILGAYYYWDKAGYDPLLLRGAALGFPDPLGPDMLLVDDNVTTTSSALYGQATAEVLSGLNLTLGLRYTDEERSAEGGMTLLAASVAAPLTSQSPGREASWDELTYRAALDYRVGEGAMVYASYNRGFKSGVFDLLGFAQPGFDAEYPDGRALTARPVDPEILDAYEVGAKAGLLGGALQLNAAAFFNDFQNIQVVQIVEGATRTLNAGAAEITGLELELTATPTDRLTLSGGLSLMDGEYTEFPVGPRWMNNPDPAPPLIAVDSDLTGNDTIHTPPFSATLALSYEIPMRTGDVDLDLAYYYNDGFFWEPDNGVVQPSHHLINGSVGWTSPDGSLEARLWGRNLADEQYFSWASASAFGALYSPAAPRTYGVTLSYRFGS
jgi:iron complex outermembrane receptor protein